MTVSRRRSPRNVLKTFHHVKIWIECKMRDIFDGWPMRVIFDARTVLSRNCKVLNFEYFPITWLNRWAGKSESHLIFIECDAHFKTHISEPVFGNFSIRKIEDHVIGILSRKMLVSFDDCLLRLSFYNCYLSFICRCVHIYWGLQFCACLFHISDFGTSMKYMMRTGFSGVRMETTPKRSAVATLLVMKMCWYMGRSVFSKMDTELQMGKTGPQWHCSG